MVVAANAPTTPPLGEPSIPNDVSHMNIQALIGKPTSNPPPSSACRAWLELQEVAPDLAQWGFGDDLGTYSQFHAYPIKAGQPTAIVNQTRFDTLPEPGNSCAAIAVYQVQNDWLLVHSDNGWYWIYCPLDRLIKFDPSTYKRSALYKWPFGSKPETEFFKGSQPNEPDLDGYVTYREIETIKPCKGELLRESPNLTSPSLGPVKGEYINLVSFSGDWVKVIEPKSILWQPHTVEGESRPILRVRWDQDRVGWIRWRIPGPIPGTFHVLLRGRAYFGYYD